jgi:hypothetical protein
MGCPALCNLALDESVCSAVQQRHWLPGAGQHKQSRFEAATAAAVTGTTTATHTTTLAQQQLDQLATPLVEGACACLPHQRHLGSRYLCMPPAPVALLLKVLVCACDTSGTSLQHTCSCMRHKRHLSKGTCACLPSHRHLSKNTCACLTHQRHLFEDTCASRPH